MIRILITRAENWYRVESSNGETVDHFDFIYGKRGSVRALLRLMKLIMHIESPYALNAARGPEMKASRDPEPAPLPPNNPGT